MFKLIRKLLVVLMFGWVGTANAALLPPVSVNGQEWLQPLDFVNRSYGSIASVCDYLTGVCSGSLGGNDLTGWTWASIGDVNALFTAFGIPGFTGTDERIEYAIGGNSVWAPAFLDAFYPTSTNAVFGWIRNPDFQILTASGGVVDNAVSPPGLPIDAAITEMRWQPSEFNTGRADMGGWFFRKNTAEVPIPGTLFLLGGGLAALGLRLRERISS